MEINNLSDLYSAIHRRYNIYFDSITEQFERYGEPKDKVLVFAYSFDSKFVDEVYNLGFGDIVNILGLKKHTHPIIFEEFYFAYKLIHNSTSKLTPMSSRITELNEMSVWNYHLSFKEIKNDFRYNFNNSSASNFFSQVGKHISKTTGLPTELGNYLGRAFGATISNGKDYDELRRISHIYWESVQESRQQLNEWFLERGVKAVNIELPHLSQ